MSSEPANSAPSGRIALSGDTSEVIAALVRADGTASHSYSAAAASGEQSNLTRVISNLSDTLHYLCLLHGRHPGVIDHAAMRTADDAARSWLVQATSAFAAERAYLTQVTVAAGPVPSTAHQRDCAAAVSAQRHALDMLAQSDRRGCAIGAAIALVLDWVAIRKLLDMAAIRVGLEPSFSLMPDRSQTLAVADALANDPAIVRAMHFGARQLLGQHRGLWDLMQARADVRMQG